MTRHNRDNLITALLIALLAVAGVVFVLAVGGCSATEAIGNAAREAQATATAGSGKLDSADTKLGKALDVGDVGPKAKPLVEGARADVKDAKADFGKVNKLAAGIQDRVNNGDIRDNEWAGWFWIKWCVIVGPVVFLVIRFWPLISVAIGWIPAVFKQRAKVAVDFVTDPTPTTDADIETVRAIDKAKRDPRFDAAFKAEATARGVVV